MRHDPERPTKRELVHALLLALACSVLFLRGALLPGRALVPHPPELFDVHMAEAIARGTFDRADALRGNVGMGDKYWQSLCWDRVLHDRLRAGELPAWTRDIGGGAPFAPQMAQPWQPLNALLLLLPPEQWYGWVWLVQQALFGFFAYGFLRRIGCAHTPALLGLVVAALGLWTQCKVHHNVVLTAALATWPMLSAAHELATRTRGDRTAATVGWLALWTGLSWSSGFVITSQLATWLTILFAVFCACRQPRGARAAGLANTALGLLLGLVLALPNTAPIALAWLDSARRAVFDADRVAAHGIECAHLLTLCWPDLLSWPADRVYAAPRGLPPSEWFTRMPWAQLALLDRPTGTLPDAGFHGYVETAFACGAAAAACIGAAFVERVHRSTAWFFAAAAALAFGCATGVRPFADLAHVVPGLAAGDLRRCLFVVAVAATVLAAFGADALIRGHGLRLVRGSLGAIAAASAAALVWLHVHRGESDFVAAMAAAFAPGIDAAAAAAAAQAAAAPGEIAHNQAMLGCTAWRALAASLLALAATWLPRAWPAFAFALIAAIELLHAGLGPIVTVPAARVTTPPAVLAPVLAATEANGVRPRLQRFTSSARLEAALPGNFPGYLGIEDGSRYSALAPQRAGEYFRAIEPDRDGKPPVAYRTAGIGSFHDAASLRHPLCDLFGIRFVLTREPLTADATLVDRTPEHTGGFRLLERTTALPRATFVHDVDLLPDRDERLGALARSDRDVATRIVLEDPAAPRCEPRPTHTATVAIVEHRDERVAVRVDCDAAGWLRLADPHDAGWRATIDGEATAVFVADHWLRAVFVPRGIHDVVFTFDAARVVWPPRIGVAALCVIAALLLLRRRPR